MILVYRAAENNARDACRWSWLERLRMQQREPDFDTAISSAGLNWPQSPAICGGHRQVVVHACRVASLLAQTASTYFR
jgi:hypothetical protein